jgi:hypothetical protein
MPIRGEWEVELAISGPITIRKPIVLNVEKGPRLPFWTTVKITKAPHGVLAKIVARARGQKDANDAAVYFVGQMLDVLSLQTDLPLYLSLEGVQFRAHDTNTKRLIESHEWSDAFKLGREYGLKRPTFSRALSWYRKGLTSEDPIDKFLAFWSSIEGVGAKFARPNDRTRQGAINQICDCFDQLWDSTDKWKVIPNDAQCVNRFHDTRNGISHGFITVNVETLQEIASELPKLQELAYNFLSDWENSGPSSEPGK